MALRNFPFSRPVMVAACLLLLSKNVSAAVSATPPAPKPKTQNQKSKRLTLPALDPALQVALKAAPKASEWPNNNYARLLDLADVTVSEDGTVVAEYRATIKLFNERARALAEVNLPYNSSYQHVQVIRARTIKKDGTVVEVKPGDIRVTSPYSDFLMYDDALGTSFSMPGVEDDCVIDYTWREETRPVFMPGQFSLEWAFSGPEPVVLSRFVLHTPADKPFQSRAVNDPNLKPLEVSALNGRTKTYTWEKRDVKPLELEPAMPPPSQIRSWLQVSSLGSWQNIAQWYWKLAQPQAKPTDAIRQTVATLTAGKVSQEDKARAIYDWVANHTRYVGLEFGLSAYRPHPAADVHDKLYGDCKDKATLLVTMLGLAGIPAHPVLLQAEDRRIIEAGLPSLGAFNHCIALAEVGGKEVWLDATAETCAYGDIPVGDRGVQAFVIKDGKGEFKTIPTYRPEENGMDVTTKVVLREDGSADTSSEVSMRGAAGQAMRAAVRSKTPEKRKQMAQQIAQSFSTGASLKAFNLPDGMDKTGPFALQMTVTAPRYAKRAGNLLLVSASGGAGGNTQTNPYLQEKRVWPIVSEDSSLTRSTTSLTLPDGYSVEDLPADVNLTGPLQEYHRTIVKSVDGKTIQVTDTVVERAGSIPPENYAGVRLYYDALLKAGEDQIVLRKAK